ncbi:hypothetical protein B0O99DRAFT_588535 [Bisporella sp. PMI_857]|nr:hypothetical protein B0O99DRAFT_588535 [Bisporella sp. PMI_857]
MRHRNPIATCFTRERRGELNCQFAADIARCDRQREREFGREHGYELHEKYYSPESRLMIEAGKNSNQEDSLDAATSLRLETWREQENLGPDLATAYNTTARIREIVFESLDNHFMDFLNSSRDVTKAIFRNNQQLQEREQRFTNLHDLSQPRRYSISPEARNMDNADVLQRIFMAIRDSMWAYGAERLVDRRVQFANINPGIVSDPTRAFSAFISALRRGCGTWTPSERMDSDLERLLYGLSVVMPRSTLWTDAIQNIRLLNWEILE